MDVNVPRLPALILLLAPALICLPGCGDKKAAPPETVSIYFTCDTRGRLEPCGCFKGQFGGLTRLKTVLDQDVEESAIRVDVGDAVGGREDYDIIQYRYLQRAYGSMKFDALNMGHREAQLTADQLQALRRGATVPLISANLVAKATGKPIFDAYRILERGRFRIAVVGVVDPRDMADEPGAGVAILEMESTLAKILPDVRSKADVIVLLAFTDEAGLARLARQFFEVQVILGGKVSQPAQELRRENRSVLYYVANESRSFGALRLQLAEEAPLRVVSHEIRLLHDRIPQEHSIRELAQAYRDEVRKTRLAVDNPTNAAADIVPGIRAAASYVGTERCVECHKVSGASWAKSAHARAFDTLVDRKADADPKCIGCHTVGFGTVSGYRREFGRSKLVDTGCESCHGPGSLHVRQRAGDETVNFTYRPLGAGDCQKCHYGEFSRPFHWDEFWPIVQHGKEPAANAVGGGKNENRARASR